MKYLLNGIHVLVTRPEHQADNLCNMIEQQGGTPIRFPTLAIVENDNADLNANTKKPAIFNLSSYDLVIFTSTNAVNFALKANGGKIGGFNAIKIAAIGQATAKALKSAGLTVDLMPEQGFNSEALLDLPELQNVGGKAVLVVRGKGGREELADVLRDKGASVDYWEVYKRIIPKIDNSKVINLLDKKMLDFIVITSGEALQNLITLLGAKRVRQMISIHMVVISLRLSKLAEAEGFLNVVVTQNPSDAAIVESLIAVTK